MPSDGFYLSIHLTVGVQLTHLVLPSSVEKVATYPTLKKLPLTRPQGLAWVLKNPL